MRFFFLISVVLLQAACTGIPDNIQPVTGFDAEKYLGKWYEIARLDHSFERGLSSVTADYSERPDGGIKVLNKGYSSDKKQWKTAEGRAYFVKDRQTGHLKVSFFGPFYGSYVVFKLDKNYQYAFITSYNKEYLWLLARKPAVSADVLQEFKNLAREKGFNLDELIIVSHSHTE